MSHVIPGFKLGCPLTLTTHSAPALTICNFNVCARSPVYRPRASFSNVLALVSQLPSAHSNCRLLMLMNFDIRTTMTGGRVRLAGCSLDWFTEQRMHPGSETCFNMSSAVMMMMVFIFILISNALFYYLYLWLKIKLWQDLSQFPDLASLFTFVNCQLKLRQLA